MRKPTNDNPRVRLIYWVPLKNEKGVAVDVQSECACVFEKDHLKEALTCASALSEHREDSLIERVDVCLDDGKSVAEFVDTKMVDRDREWVGDIWAARFE